MKKLALNILLFTSFGSFAQQQIGNSNMEAWENVGSATEEPNNWNSFKTGTGGLSGFASKQIERSTAIRSGATGTYCARIYSVSILSAIANGNMTLGQINMGSSTPTSSSNYNFSKTADANFSEALTDQPDSIVFWVKYTPINSGDQARVHAILHDSYDFRDPIDANSVPHTVARAELNYGSTNGVWVRKSVPFVYEGPATTNAFILVSFTTNKTQGGGAANDEVLIDDVELIYNPAVGVSELQAPMFKAYYSVENGLQIKGDATAKYEVVNLSGASEKTGNQASLTGLTLKSGMYFVKSANAVVKVLVP